MDLKELQKEINLNLVYNNRYNKITVTEKPEYLDVLKIKKFRGMGFEDSVIWPKLDYGKILTNIIESNENKIVSKYLK